MALKELNIDYISRDAWPLAFGTKWGTHKFNKRNEEKLKTYFNGKIIFSGHSVWITGNGV